MVGIHDMCTLLCVTMHQQDAPHPPAYQVGNDDDPLWRGKGIEKPLGGHVPDASIRHYRNGKENDGDGGIGIVEGLSTTLYRVVCDGVDDFHQDKRDRPAVQKHVRRWKLMVCKTDIQHPSHVKKSTPKALKMLNILSTGARVSPAIEPLEPYRAPGPLYTWIGAWITQAYSWQHPGR